VDIVMPGRVSDSRPRRLSQATHLLEDRQHYCSGVFIEHRMSLLYICARNTTGQVRCSIRAMLPTTYERVLTEGFNNGLSFGRRQRAPQQKRL
jgi:hypothetical protein